MDRLEFEAELKREG
jgi:quercetin dioxygenase-like cupin family protein